MSPARERPSEEDHRSEGSMRAAGRRSATEEEHKPGAWDLARTDRQVPGMESPKPRLPRETFRHCAPGPLPFREQPSRALSEADKRTHAPERQERGRAPEPRGVSSSPAIVESPNVGVMPPMAEDHPVPPASGLVHHGPGDGHRARHRHAPWKSRCVEEPQHGKRPEKRPR